MHFKRQIFTTQYLFIFYSSVLRRHRKHSFYETNINVLHFNDDRNVYRNSHALKFTFFSLAGVCGKGRKFQKRKLGWELDRKIITSSTDWWEASILMLVYISTAEKQALPTLVWETKMNNHALCFNICKGQNNCKTTITHQLSVKIIFQLEL